MSIKHPKITVLSWSWGTQSTVHCINIFILEFLEIKMSGAVNPNTSHSPPVCTMFNEKAQYLKFFMLFPGVTIMTSTSHWWRHHQNFAWYFEGVDLNLGYAPAGVAYKSVAYKSNACSNLVQSNLSIADTCGSLKKCPLDRGLHFLG